MSTVLEWWNLLLLASQTGLSVSETVADVPNAPYRFVSEMTYYVSSGTLNSTNSTQPYRCNFVKCKCKIQKQLNRPKAESNMLLGYSAIHACNYWKETAKIKLSSHAMIYSYEKLQVYKSNSQCNYTYRADMLAWLHLHLQAAQMRCFSGCKCLDTGGSDLGVSWKFWGLNTPYGR